MCCCSDSFRSCLIKPFLLCWIAHFASTHRFRGWKTVIYNSQTQSIQHILLIAASQNKRTKAIERCDTARKESDWDKTKRNRWIPYRMYYYYKQRKRSEKRKTKTKQRTTKVELSGIRREKLEHGKKRAGGKKSGIIYLLRGFNRGGG